MKSVLLKLEIKIAGQKGKLKDFLKSVETKKSSHEKTEQTVIHATAYVKDDSEFSKIYTPTNKELINGCF